MAKPTKVPALTNRTNNKRVSFLKLILKMFGVYHRFEFFRIIVSFEVFNKAFLSFIQHIVGKKCLDVIISQDLIVPANANTVLINDID